MTDRYDDKYKDQYTKETSQIHAPAELIQKTRQAVAEEEKRLQTGSMVHVLPEQQSEGEQSNSRRYFFHARYGKIFRWALPAAAAVILVFVLNMSGILLSGGRQNSQSGSASEMEAAGSSEDGSRMDNGSSEAIVEESEGFEEQNTDGAEAAEDMETAESTEEPGSAEESGGAESAMSGADDFAVQKKESAMRDEINANRDELNNLSRDTSQSTDSMAEADSVDQYDRTSGAPGANVENSSSAQLLIEKVKTVPSFRNDSDTECIVSHGIRFYIAEDEDGDRVADKATGENHAWKAYAEYNGGRYIITGSAVDQEEFSEKAAERLVETAGES